MKGEASELFAAFKFRVGDLVKSRTQPDVLWIITARFLVDSMDWQPLYFGRHLGANGAATTGFFHEAEVKKL